MKDEVEYYFLIVDNLDHQIRAIKRAIREVIERSEFIKATTLAEALEVIRGMADPIDLAVVDLKLTDEGEEGIEVIRTIRNTNHRQKVKTILITAFPGAENKTKAEECGADDYVNKLNASHEIELQEKVKKLLCL